MMAMDRLRQRLPALGMLALPFLTFPMLGLPEGEWRGLPALYVYLFVAWLFVLILAAWLAERERG
mgnify:CR=1 FL=1